MRCLRRLVMKLGTSSGRLVLPCSMIESTRACSAHGGGIGGGSALLKRHPLSNAGAGRRAA